jgi:DNA-binding transcriptional LysR family regulator
MRLRENAVAMNSKDTDPKVAKVADRSAGSRLRLLDFDDLFLLGHLLEGNTIAATAKLLGLTQPAITQRVRKIERVFEEPILQKAGRHVKLTPGGHAVCVKAADALALMRAVTTEPAKSSLQVGAASATGSTWLWPALLDLRVTSPDHQYHCHVGTDDDMLQALEAGVLDAMLTSKGVSAANQAALELGEEEFVLVASPELAKSLTSVEDLANAVLLELDRSYPLLARLSASSRAMVRFRDVWFAGAYPHLAQAAAMGHGVAVLPASLARPGLAQGKLVQVLPELELEAAPQRLIYRTDRGVDELAKALGQALLRLRPKA